MKIVIIGHNEGEHIVNMYKSLRDYPYQRIWVLDRCTDDSKNILENILGERYVIEHDGDKDARYTSTCRNLGYKVATEDNTILDDILFLDGDRYIKSGDISTLMGVDSDIVLLKVEQEMRDKIDDYQRYYGHVYNFFFSCGMFIRKDACRRLTEFYKANTKTYGDSVIFPTNIEQDWGIEDTHLGDICYHLGLTCTLNNDIRLNGTFTRGEVDTVDVIEKRFVLRDKLNVIW